VFTSPYLRARATAKLVEQASGFAPGASDIVVDERLREKEFGILDRLTRLGIEQRHPDQAASRRFMGKFYYRPPAGESWCDVILRLRAVLDSISLHCGGKRVLIIGHQVVVLCTRYLLENMNEQAIIAIDAEGDVANCAVTEYGFEAEGEGTGSLVLRRYNFVAPLEQEGAPVTREPDANVAAR
jgi:probable phosphoglycerate mutase